MQRHRVGQPDNVPGDHCNSAKFADRAAIAQQDAVQQSPLDVRQGHAAEGLPTTGAEHRCGFLLGRTLGLH